MKRVRYYKNTSGFSLVELMISMAIGLYLIAGLVMFMQSSTSTYVSTNHMAQVQDSGRTAMGIVSGSLRRSGFKGLYVHPLNDILGTEGVQSNSNKCNSTGNSWATMVGQSVFSITGRDDSDVSELNYDCLGNEYLRGDVVTVRYLSREIGPATIANDDTLYFRGSLSYGAIFKGEDKNQPGNSPAGNPMTTHRLVANSFYIGDSGRTCEGESIPSLFRVATLPNGKPYTEEIVPGIENLQVRFLMDGSYKDPDEIGLGEWENVSAARVWILARSSCIEAQYTEDRTFEMGDRSKSPKDHFRRQLFTKTVKLRNRI